MPCDRVLCVNDDPDMLSTLKDVLELEGAAVETATSIEEVEQILGRGFHPSAAVVDLRLGRGERGQDLIAMLRRDPAHADLPIVAMSGDLHALRRIGDEADATLGKPFAVDDLYQVLTDLCGGARRDRRERSTMTRPR